MSRMKVHYKNHKDKEGEQNTADIHVGSVFVYNFVCPPSLSIGLLDFQKASRILPMYT